MYNLAGVIVDVIILVVIAWLVSIAPFIEGTFKSFIIWALMAIGAIIIVLFILGIAGGSGVIRL